MTSKNDSFSSMSESRYLKQSDLSETGNLVTISRYDKQNVGTEDEPDTKHVVYFNEFEKPLVLNKINRDTLMELFDDSRSASIGQQVVIYVKDDVEYAGKRVGGIRIRAKKGAKPAPKADPEDDGEIPF